MPAVMLLIKSLGDAFRDHCFSRDPVALDVLSIKELDRQRQLASGPTVKPNLKLYSIAALLQLGVNDLKRIDVVTLP